MFLALIILIQERRFSSLCNSLQPFVTSCLLQWAPNNHISVLFSNTFSLPISFWQSSPVPTRVIQQAALLSIHSWIWSLRKQDRKCPRSLLYFSLGAKFVSSFHKNSSYSHWKMLSYLSNRRRSEHQWGIVNGHISSRYLLGWVHTCNVTAYRNTVSWQCGRDS
jgi:hypothetical protein